MELVQLSDVRKVLDIPDAATDMDDLLTLLVKAVSEQFEIYSGRGAEQKTRTEYFDVTRNTSVIELNAWPVDSITNLQQDIDRNFGDDFEIDTNYYHLDDANGVIDLFQKYPVGDKTIKVVYVGGMAVLDGPAEGSEFWSLWPQAAMAIMDQIAYEYKALPNIGKSAVSIKDAKIQVHRELHLLPRFKQVAMNYGRII